VKRALNPEKRDRVRITLFILNNKTQINEGNAPLGESSAINTRRRGLFSGVYNPQYIKARSY
jgi:hypothetical protein